MLSVIGTGFGIAISIVRHQPRAIPDRKIRVLLVKRSCHIFLNILGKRPAFDLL
ncbi:hypothetical protein [Paracoccus albus]|uniref:hypothetical protein n=1 Tax=Paracoccus albus TaxID=3017784 RepID=UPI0022F13CD6|nr:hypothetical protein [Paracoccus albus]WBU59246.1 hypothetical protein PAF20_10670 [Paracoccus albus]